MRWTGTVTGSDTISDGQVAVNKIVFTDAASVSAPNSSAFYVLRVTSANTAAGNTAARPALHSRTAVGGQVGAGPTGIGPGVTDVAHLGSLSECYATASQGGLGGWTAGHNPSLGYYRGGLFGGNDNIWLTTGATNWFHVIGREVDVGIKGTDSTCYARMGVLLMSTTSTRQADADDAGLVVASNSTAGTNWKNGIQFGLTSGQLDLTDSLIKVVATAYPSPATPALVNGVDISAATFSGSAFKSPGFTVDGAGNVQSTPLVSRNFASDSAAASGGVPIGGLYHNAGVVHVRLT